MSFELSLLGERLVLMPERALWWPAQKAVIISDLHWGKSAHFRKHGIPMPGGTQKEDAFRLAQLLQRCSAERLIIAGDLFHSKHNAEVDDFLLWRNAHPHVKMELVMGNHDILEIPFYESLNLDLFPEFLNVGPFEIRHDGAAVGEGFAVRGHLHPGVRIPGPGAALPCFCIDESGLTLPAFGRFTGCKRIDPMAYAQVFVIGEERVWRLK
jgi:DNA ligase-associated metallophosphoesterase